MAFTGVAKIPFDSQEGDLFLPTILYDSLKSQKNDYTVQEIPALMTAAVMKSIFLLNWFSCDNRFNEKPISPNYTKKYLTVNPYIQQKE